MSYHMIKIFYQFENMFLLLVIGNLYVYWRIFRQLLQKSCTVRILKVSGFVLETDKGFFFDKTPYSRKVGYSVFREGMTRNVLIFSNRIFDILF